MKSKDGGKNGSRDSRRRGIVATYVSDSGSVEFITGTVDTIGKKPFTMGFFVDPRAQDGHEKVVEQTMHYLLSHGVQEVCFEEKARPVYEAFCHCCGSLTNCCLGASC